MPNSSDFPLVYERASEAAAFLESKTQLRPLVAVVLGSGLGGFASTLEDSLAIPFAEIPHFPQSTVPGHSGRLIVGTLNGTPVAVMPPAFLFVESRFRGLFCAEPKYRTARIGNHEPPDRGRARRSILVTIAETHGLCCDGPDNAQWEMPQWHWSTAVIDRARCGSAQPGTAVREFLELEVQRFTEYHFRGAQHG